MTYPPQQPDDRAGLGEPVTDVPQMQAPTPVPPMSGPPPAAMTSPGDAPPPSALPPQLTQPPPPPPPRPSRTPWAAVAALGSIAVIGLIVAIVVIHPDPEVKPEDVAGGNSEQKCEPAEKPKDDPLHAEEFYEDKTWTNSTAKDDSAKRLGQWDHEDCCDVGLASSQETLNDAGCAYGIESAYKSADGHLGIAQLVLAFNDAGSAASASDIDFTSFKMKPESGIYDDSAEVYGYIEPSGSFLVVTVGSIDSEKQSIVDDAVKTLGDFHYDHLEELPW